MTDVREFLDKQQICLRRENAGLSPITYGRTADTKQPRDGGRAAEQLDHFARR